MITNFFWGALVDTYRQTCSFVYSLWNQQIFMATKQISQSVITRLRSGEHANLWRKFNKHFKAQCSCVEIPAKK